MKSQTREIDSLSKVLITVKEDTNKAKTLILLSFKLMVTGEYVQAFHHTRQLITLSEKINYKLGLGNAYATNGLLYQYQGDYPNALKNLLHALQIFEELKNQRGIAYALNNIGNIYVDMKDFDKALEHFDRTLELKKILDDKRGIASTYNNIGIIYQEKANSEQETSPEELNKDALLALKYFSSSSQIYRSLNDVEQNAYIESNIGFIYFLQNKNDLAKEYFDRALKEFKAYDMKEAIASCNINLGALAVRLNQMDLAKDYYETALSISKNIGNNSAIKDCYDGLFKFYSKKGDYRSALTNYQLFINYRDSLSNEENTKKFVQAQMNYEFDKKEQVAKLDQEKKDAIALEEKQKQAIIRNSFIGGFVLLCLLSVFIFRGYRNKQRSNIQLESMNKIIVEKNKNITDSINYAKRIQSALMTSEKYIDKSISRLSKKK